MLTVSRPNGATWITLWKTYVTIFKLNSMKLFCLFSQLINSVFLLVPPHNCFGPPFLFVEGLLSTGPTLSSSYLLHCESGEGLWLTEEAALQTHRFRDAAPQPIIFKTNIYTYIECPPK